MAVVVAALSPIPVQLTGAGRAAGVVDTPARVVATRGVPLPSAMAAVQCAYALGGWALGPGAPTLVTVPLGAGVGPAAGAVMARVEAGRGRQPGPVTPLRR